MPSPGISVIKPLLSVPFTIGTFNTSINQSSDFTIKLANALHNGWTSSTPTTPTTMEVSIISEFSGYVNVSGPYGTGWQHLLCLGQGIDLESAAWVASWVSSGGYHSYVVNYTSILSRIISCYPWNSASTQAIAEAVSNVYSSYFIQEVG